MVERAERPACLFVDELARTFECRHLLVIVNGMPKCVARQVTVSSSPMWPAVTPAMACSFDADIDERCASMSSDRSKTTSTGASMSVSCSARPPADWSL